jgi:hypothetical protein
MTDLNQHLHRALEVVLETLKTDQMLLPELIKGFIVGVVNMEMDDAQGKLQLNGRIILDDLYEKFPGLKDQIKAFVEE